MTQRQGSRKLAPAVVAVLVWNLWPVNGPFSGCGSMTFKTSEGVDGSSWCSFGRLPFVHCSCFKQADAMNCSNSSTRVHQLEDILAELTFQHRVVLLHSFLLPDRCQFVQMALDHALQSQMESNGWITVCCFLEHTQNHVDPNPAMYYLFFPFSNASRSIQTIYWVDLFETRTISKW